MMCQKRSTIRTQVMRLNAEDIVVVRTDACMKPMIYSLNQHGYDTRGCCCGHGRYPMTVVCRTKTGRHYDLISGVDIPRKKRYYVRDKEGYFYIPEVVEFLKSINGD